MQDPKEIAIARDNYKKIIYVDVDSTICHCDGDYDANKTYVGGYKAPDYNTCIPYKKRIEKVNKLYDDGYFILYWTARGTMTQVDWRELTEKQLKGWGCKYHKLVLKKPCYDLFIDDKNINSESFFCAETI